MMLSIEDVKQFFRLHRALMFFVNRTLQVIDKEVATPEAYSSLPPTSRIKVHQALLERRDLIDAFVAENPFGFDEDDRAILRSWNDLVTGKFLAFRQLRKHMIFLTTEEPVIAYGVVALFDPFEAIFGPDLPQMLATTLLPFKGMIVYDGLVTAYSITFGGGYRRGLNESYQEAKERFGVVESLPPPAPEPRPTRKKAAPGKRPTEASTTGGDPTIPEAVRPAHGKIVAVTDAFSHEHLDDEFAALCRKLAGVLARKRPSPLTRGKPESWAAGIARVVGRANFIDDPSQPRPLRMSEIDGRIGVSEATGSAKATAIRNLLKIHPLDPQWTLPSRMDDNPMIWMLQVNGLFVDIRHAPREVQEIAFKKGLIPYVPADRQGGSARGR